MIIECHNSAHGVKSNGDVDCPEPYCLVASVHGLPPLADPMDRLPARRPSWILQSPDQLDEAEVEALAVLGDVGLVPQIVSPSWEEDSSSDAWPARRVLRHLAG